MAAYHDVRHWNGESALRQATMRRTKMKSMFSVCLISAKQHMRGLSLAYACQAEIVERCVPKFVPQGSVQKGRTSGGVQVRAASGS